MAIYLTALRADDKMTLSWLAHVAQHEVSFPIGAFKTMLEKLVHFVPSDFAQLKIRASELPGANRNASICCGCERIRFVEEMDDENAHSRALSEGAVSQNYHPICRDCAINIKKEPQSSVAIRVKRQRSSRLNSNNRARADTS